MASAQAENVAGTTIATRSGWARAARSIARASSAVAAIRASVRTCLPASSAAIVTGAWRIGQAPTSTASIAGSATQRLPRRVRTLEAERIGGAS